jgi:hypothetical protein
MPGYGAGWPDCTQAGLHPIDELFSCWLVRAGVLRFLLLAAPPGRRARHLIVLYLSMVPLFLMVR